MTNQVQPPDLEMRVRTVPENGWTRLMYTLHSPTGVAPFSHREIPGPMIQGSPEEYQVQLLKKIEQLGERLDVEGERILRVDIERKLAGIGRLLWRELFPPELQHAYRAIRRTVRTWMVITDEPWIPWELIKPFDDSRPEEMIDDDFLSLQYELTRWLAGDKNPSREIAVRQLAAIWTDSKLPQSEGEQSWLADLATRRGIANASRSPKSPGELLSFLEEGGVDLLHFIGHGTFATEAADESAIPLPNGRSFRPGDLEGPVAARIGRDRPLVILNACWGGQQGWSLTRTGGWPAHWVGVSGCGAFVAPMWPVRDQAALAFARAFYEALERGATLGRAALEARQHLRATREAGDISTLGYTVYGHPNARVLFGDETLIVNPREDPPAPPAIREKIRSFNLLIQRKTEGFVGRQWLFDAIDRFVQGHPQGYVQILGDPGIGKTALIAEMVKRHRHPHHFNIRAEGIQKPDQFLPSLCAQLVAKFGLGYQTLPPEVSRDSSFLVNLLEKASAKLKPTGRKLIVLVDALDESDLTSVTRGSNTLYLPSDLPDGVFFVVTSRRTKGEREIPLRYTCDDRKIDLEPKGSDNFADIRLYTEGWIDREGIRLYIQNQGLDARTFVDEIVRLSEGNFMYLRYVLPEIEKGTYKDRRFDTLPSGLENYYEDNWIRMREGDPAAWSGYKLPVLVALTIAKEPISMDLIKDFSGVEKRTEIRAALEEWAGFLQPVEVEENGSKETRWRLYHESFHEFVADKDQVQDGRREVNLKDAHGKAADALWKALYPQA